MAVKCFTHTVSLEVYPQAHYLMTKSKDVHKTFTSLISKKSLSDLYKDEIEIESLSAFSQISDILTCHVIGKTDIDDTDLRVITKSSKASKEQVGGITRTGQTTGKSQTTGNGLTVYICNIVVTEVGTKGLEKVSESLAFLNSMVGSVENISDSVMIVIQAGGQQKPSSTKFAPFIKDVQAKTEVYLKHQLRSESIVMGVGDLGNHLSTWIKTMTVSCNLERMQAYLKNFIRIARDIRNEDITIIHSEEFVTAVEGFLRNGYAFVDILHDGGDEPFIDLLLKSLKKTLRCSIVQVTSIKYGFVESVCNRLAHAYGLEDKLAGAVIKNTQYLLNQMEQDCRDLYKAVKSEDKYHSFPAEKFVYIACSIRNDVEKVVSDFEQSLLSLKTPAYNMRKLLFEIRSLQQKVEPDEPNVTHVPYDLFQQLKQFKYVFGVGTIYGDVEIHVGECDIRNAESEIKEALNQMSYQTPVRIKKILGFPKRLFQQGAALRPAHTDTLDETLGCFLKTDKCKDLYGITCAHMFEMDNGQQRQVSVYTNGVLQPFATSDPALRIMTGEPQLPVIDIAALRVMDNVRDRCNRRLRNEEGDEYNGLLCEEPVVEVGDSVYKRGAGSDFTEGTVISTDYLMQGASNGDMRLVLIESKDAGTPYARKGDSGAVNCMTQFKEHECFVRVVSVISGSIKLKGDSLEGEPIQRCISFPIEHGIGAISERSGMLLELA